MCMPLGPLFPSRLVRLLILQWHHSNALWFLIKYLKDVVYPLSHGPMSGKNRRLVADEPVEFKTSRNLPIILEESIEYTSNK